MARSASGARIWHLCSNRWFSAITDYALSAAVSLQQQGMESVFFPLAASPGEKRARELNLPTVPLSKFAFQTGLPLFRKPFWDKKPDWIIAYGGPEAFLARILARTHRCRIARFRGQAPDTQRSNFGLKSLSRFDRLLYPSPILLAQETSGLTNIDARIVELGRPLPPDLPALPVWQLDPVIRIVGRLDPIKGHEMFIDTFARVLRLWPEGQPRLRLEIIGEPANLTVDDLAGWMNRAGLRRQQVALVTRRHPNIHEAMSSALMGAVPSLGSEIICRVAEEFQLCGAPVVVSGIGSLEDALVFDGGMSYRGLQGEALVQALLKFCHQAAGESLADRQQRRQRAQQRFSLDIMGKALLTALEIKALQL